MTQFPGQGMPCRRALQGCPAGDAPAPDLATLVATRPDARLLDAGAEELALLLPQFARATASTVGGAALLSEGGGYAQPRMAGARLASPAGRVALRLSAGRGERLAYTAADPARGAPAALHLFDPAGRTTHRAEIAAPEDLLLLAALVAQIPTGAGEIPVVPDTAPAVIPHLPTIRHARAHWPRAELARHIDDLVLDGGRSRRACLPHVGPGAARRIEPRVLDHVLDLLARRRFTFRRAVIRPGCLQSHEGVLDSLWPEGDLLVMTSARATMALDLERVADVWVTALGPAGGERATALELYDHDGAAIAAFLPATRGELGHAAAWDALLASLPAPRSAARAGAGGR
ncbi:MAG: hypothetical protein DI556_14765 [Rhodovulum sulfidophilum]|uniref:Haemin-degrading HemS/ChuX domain-containing protein n=1 Tax=Rhodovulum sulfidophilum TaxID=35806 RepID=A0A2W5N4G6_RHOSU|nr:MAG: hypothetical protein DI556_14765 [Rhodovulum sulfidophilum]